MKLSNSAISAALKSIELSELPAEHPRRIARKAVAQYRQTARLSQQMIDSGSDEEERRQRFIQSSVKWSKRSLLSRLLRRG